MRTEWFIWVAAVVLLVLGSIAIVDLRTEDSPTAVESPSPSPSPTVEPTTPAPTESETAEPSPSPTPSPSVSPSVEPSPTASPTATPSPEPTGATGGGNASPITYASASFTASNSRFSAAGASSRAANFEQSCPVVAQQGETFSQCRAAFSSTRSRWWAVTEVAQGGGHVATLWQHNGAGAFNRVSTTGAYSADMTLGGPTWPNHDDVMTLDFGSSLEVLSYETSAGPIVTGVVPLSSSASFDVLAQRVFVRTSGANRTTTVLELNPGGGLEGRRAQLSAASDRSPEEVALVVYRAWINNNRAGAAPWVNDRVDEALFEDTPNQGGDLFELTGTSCPLADGAFTCTFTYPFGTMMWEIRPVNGVLRVVDIESSG